MDVTGDLIDYFYGRQRGILLFDQSYPKLDLSPRSQIQNIFTVLVIEDKDNLLMLATEFRCW